MRSSRPTSCGFVPAASPAYPLFDGLRMVSGHRRRAILRRDACRSVKKRLFVVNGSALKKHPMKEETPADCKPSSTRRTKNWDPEADESGASQQPMAQNRRTLRVHPEITRGKERRKRAAVPLGFCQRSVQAARACLRWMMMLFESVFFQRVSGQFRQSSSGAGGVHCGRCFAVWASGALPVRRSFPRGKMKWDGSRNGVGDGSGNRAKRMCMPAR